MSAGAIRLDRLLANLGYGSRREIGSLVRAGRVVLDGAEVTAADLKVPLAADLPLRLFIDATPLDPLPGLVLMMHKPVGLTCSHDEAGALVYDLLPDRWRRRDPPLSTVGRLDKDTSGLLLLTDDGALLHRIASPKRHAPRRYRATLAEPLAPEAAAIFGSGKLMLAGETKPLLAADLAQASATAATVTVGEGRYHQVRRMFAAVGNRVVTLHRDRIGGLDLPADLPPGAYRALDASEIALLAR